MKSLLLTIESQLISRSKNLDARSWGRSHHELFEVDAGAQNECGRPCGGRGAGGRLLRAGRVGLLFGTGLGESQCAGEGRFLCCLRFEGAKLAQIGPPVGSKAPGSL